MSKDTAALKWDDLNRVPYPKIGARYELGKTICRIVNVERVGNDSHITFREIQPYNGTYKEYRKLLPEFKTFARKALIYGATYHPA